MVHVNVCHSCALPALARPPPHVVFVSVPDPKKWRHWVLKSFKGKGQVECKNPRVCGTPRISSVYRKFGVPLDDCARMDMDAAVARAPDDVFKSERPYWTAMPPTRSSRRRSTRCCTRTCKCFWLRFVGIRWPAVPLVNRQAFTTATPTNDHFRKGT